MRLEQEPPGTSEVLAAPNYHQLRLNLGVLFISVLSNHPFTRKFFPFNYWQIEFMYDWHKMPPHFEDSIHYLFEPAKRYLLPAISPVYSLWGQAHFRPSPHRQ